MGRPAPGRATVDGMAWLVLLAICSAYGVFAFTWLAGFHVPAGRAAAAGAWSTLLAFVGLGIPLLVTATSCVGDGASAPVCREVQQDGASRLQLVFATPLVSTAILVGAVLLLARSRAVAGWLVALAAATALVVPFAVLDTLSGGLPA
jgi:hypothetical protein